MNDINLKTLYPFHSTLLLLAFSSQPALHAPRKEITDILSVSQYALTVQRSDYIIAGFKYS